MHSLERGDRGNPQALSELAQVVELQLIDHKSCYAAEFAQNVIRMWPN